MKKDSYPCCHFSTTISSVANESSKVSAVREGAQAFTDQHAISGSVTIVATKDKVLQLEQAKTRVIDMNVVPEEGSNIMKY